jgi:hypothetical protein
MTHRWFRRSPATLVLCCALQACLCVDVDSADDDDRASSGEDDDDFDDSSSGGCGGGFSFAADDRIDGLDDDGRDDDPYACVPTFATSSTAVGNRVSAALQAGPLAGRWARGTVADVGVTVVRSGAATDAVVDRETLASIPFAVTTIDPDLVAVSGGPAPGAPTITIGAHTAGIAGFEIRRVGVDDAFDSFAVDVDVAAVIDVPEEDVVDGTITFSSPAFDEIDIDGDGYADERVEVDEASVLVAPIELRSASGEVLLHRGVVDVEVVAGVDGNVSAVVDVAEACVCGPCPTRLVAHSLAGPTHVRLHVVDAAAPEVVLDLVLVPVIPFVEPGL